MPASWIRNGLWQCGFSLEAPKPKIPQNMMGKCHPKTFDAFFGFFGTCSNPFWIHRHEAKHPFFFFGRDNFGFIFHLHPTSPPPRLPSHLRNMRFPGGFSRIDLGGAGEFSRDVFFRPNSPGFIFLGRGIILKLSFSLQYSLPAIPCEGQYLDHLGPTSPQVRPLGGPNTSNTYVFTGMTGRFGMSTAWHPSHPPAISRGVYLHWCEGPPCS